MSRVDAARRFHLMSVVRRHPSRIQLEAWFDGEARDELAWHVIRCDRCFRYLNRTARLSASLRTVIKTRRLDDASAPLLAPGEDAAIIPITAATARAGQASQAKHAQPPQHARHTDHADKARSRRRVPMTAAALVAVLGLAGALAGPLRGTVIPGSQVAGTSSGSAGSALHAGPGVSNGSGSPRSGRTDQSGAAATSDGSGGAHSSQTGHASTGSGPGSGPSIPGAGFGPTYAAAAGHALRLAVVVPMAGPGAAEGAEVQNAAMAAVNEANSSGGVGGLPVQLQIVPAEDPTALAGLAGHVDALVGGFGVDQPSAVPSNLQWILPADPAITAPGVVMTELSPRTVGTQLASGLVAQGISGTVGVVGGPGPDSDLAAGIAKVLPTNVVQVSPGSSCLGAVSTLQQQGVVALAVAGPADLAASCVSSAQALSWQPPGGVLVPPSTAYAGLGSAAVAGTVSGVRTVLGLPWPTSSQAGAQRFESAQPGTTSYRALVTFAAIELAVKVSRTTGSLAPTAVAGGTWRNDLFDYNGLANAGAHVVTEANGGWVSAP